MTDGAARLAARYPQVWHVIEAEGAGPWLTETGLLPAAALQVGGANREGFVRIALSGGGIAVLRPQRMPDRQLLPTLAGSFAGRPECWRQYVDQHVFFWVEARRRDAFARACMRLRGGSVPSPVIVTFDTAALLERHSAIAYFASFNTGSTVRGGARVLRDENTLRSVKEYSRGAVAELAIRGRVHTSWCLHPDEIPAGRSRP